MLVLWVIVGAIGTGRVQTVPASTKRKVAIYLVAHQDDWQLFMGSNAYKDVQEVSKVIFICLTAGQANQPGDAYWQGREYGCRAAAVAAATTQMPAPTAQFDATTAAVNGHTLAVFRFRNTETYSLRLPDGGLDGQGFARGNFNSLAKLKAGAGPISSIDSSATYADWADLVTTLRQLIQQEDNASTLLFVHCPDPDRRRNCYDHPDHTMVGMLALAASRSIALYSRLRYPGEESQPDDHPDG